MSQPKSYYSSPSPAGHDSTGSTSPEPPTQSEPEHHEGPRLVAPAPRRPAVLRKRVRARPSDATGGHPTGHASSNSTGAVRIAQNAKDNLGDLHQLMRSRRGGSTGTAPPADSGTGTDKHVGIDTDVHIAGNPPRVDQSHQPVTGPSPSTATESYLSPLSAHVYRPTPSDPNEPSAPSAWTPERPLWVPPRTQPGIAQWRTISSPISRRTYLTNPLEKGLQGNLWPEVHQANDQSHGDEEPQAMQTDVRMPNGDLA